MDLQESLQNLEPDAGTPPFGAVPCVLPISALRPTQMTVGLREVTAKARRHQLGSSQHSHLAHVIPVISGPGHEAYLRDRHHLTLALHNAGIDAVRVEYIDDLSHLAAGSFWSTMEDRHWVHPFDKNGNRQEFTQLPASVLQLEDDPFRSLAGELRRRGGFSKSKVAYSEFAWADFLRKRIAGALVDQDFGAAVAMASVIARSDAASHLPGWCDPISTRPQSLDGRYRSGDPALREAV